MSGHAFDTSRIQQNRAQLTLTPILNGVNESKQLGFPLFPFHPVSRMEPSNAVKSEVQSNIAVNHAHLYLVCLGAPHPFCYSVDSVHCRLCRTLLRPLSSLLTSFSSIREMAFTAFVVVVLCPSVPVLLFPILKVSSRPTAV